MNIGFINIYSYRPHVQHSYYFSEILKRAGHDVFFLTCDGSTDACYNKLIRNKTSRVGGAVECAKCVLGGIRSFTDHNVSSIHKKIDLEYSLDPAAAGELAISSAATVHRLETDDELNDPEVIDTQALLVPLIQKVYSATRTWAAQKDLDAVILFNGRIDLTAGVKRAIEDAHLPYLTHERTWLGDGIRLIPNENCLSISEIRRIAKDFANRPLTYNQALFSAKHLASRFIGENHLEWRLYNKDRQTVSAWPSSAGSGPKYLILPSSRNEFMGHDEFETEWPDNTSAIRDLIDIFKIDTGSIVVRGHPNWGELISAVDGNRSSNHYREFCDEAGIVYIEAAAKHSTYDLINMADFVIMNGGSSSIEAAALGKKVIALAPSQFMDSGFVQTFLSRSAMKKAHQLGPDLSPHEITSRAMRHLYTAARRFPSFVSEVKAVSTILYRYDLDESNVDGILNLLSGKELLPFDGSYDENGENEKIFIDMLHAMQWDKISCLADTDGETEKLKKLLPLHRRWFLRYLDSFRGLLKRGDR
jgi:hypothetical protein